MVKLSAQVGKISWPIGLHRFRPVCLAVRPIMGLGTGLAHIQLKVGLLRLEPAFGFYK